MILTVKNENASVSVLFSFHFCVSVQKKKGMPENVKRRFTNAAAMDRTMTREADFIQTP